MPAVVVLIVNTVMVMVMTRAGATQERHRTVDEFFLRDSAVLVGVERLEQDLGTTRGARRRSRGCLGRLHGCLRRGDGWRRDLGLWRRRSGDRSFR
jgi:hypothetical protein